MWFHIRPADGMTGHRDEDMLPVHSRQNGPRTVVRPSMSSTSSECSDERPHATPRDARKFTSDREPLETRWHNNERQYHI